MLDHSFHRINKLASLLLVKSNGSNKYPNHLKLTIVKKIIVQILILISFGVTLNAQNCPNSNFSQGNFSNWTGTTGSVFTTGSPYDIPGFVAGQHEIISVSSPDPNTGGAVTTIPPGGVSSCRLGNDIAGYGAESMTYSFNVDMSNRLFVYEYAMILQDPLNIPHSALERPRFSVKTMENSGQVIPGNCSYYETY